MSDEPDDKRKYLNPDGQDERYTDAGLQRKTNRPKRTLQPLTKIAHALDMPKQSIKVSQRGTVGMTGRSAKDLIAAHTDNGADIIRFMVNALEGQVQGVQGRARIAAAEWLGQYLFGKPVETTVQLNMQSQNTSLPNMSDDDLERLARGLIAGQLPEDAGGEVVEESVQPPAGTEES
jgi:hypothetical protein